MQKSAIISPYKSTPVFIGNIPLGGGYPIRIQSMTNTDTLDTKASVAQCIRIIEAGADFVRLTAQGVREAQNLAAIKNELRKAGFNTPLIADIHFNPDAAETAAGIVEKVRINPGNYADKRAAFQRIDLTEKEYGDELERTHKRLIPLIKICSENKTVIRIGINHGSLSDRIMTRFGNTPSGMVASALEFIRIFRAENFNELVLSMKSSDTAIMIEATRQLVQSMQDEGMFYPLHLGVTEAGEGEDGRIRSAAGIGALLAEGIGDTIRISLSEDPENEIPVAKKLADFYPRAYVASNPAGHLSYKTPAVKPDIAKGINGPLVITNLTSCRVIDKQTYIEAGYRADDSGSIKKTDSSADFIIASDLPGYFPEDISLIIPFEKWLEHKDNVRVFPSFSPQSYNQNKSRSGKLNVLLTSSPLDIPYLRKADPHTTLVIFSFNPEIEKSAADQFLKALEDNDLNQHIILNPVFQEEDIEGLRIKAGALLGRFLIDKRITGICLQNKGEIRVKELTATSFSILQCTETRITRLMYLSCPTCGRTKFNLQESVRKVKEATRHLKGLKIAVMGCIVNGPGEMAGSDYGYVGAANGKVHIYRGTIPVIKNVPEKDAADELLRLIERDLSVL